MYFTLGEILIASSYLMITATVIVISAVIDCSKRKELTVESTQPSLRDNSEINVFNRDGETDIEMPSHLHKVKELREDRKSNESDVKKFDGIDDLNSKKSEKHNSCKEKNSRREQLFAKDDNQGGEAEGKDQKSAKQKQSSDAEEKLAKKCKDKQNFNINEQVVTDEREKKEGNERKEVYRICV
ncbi:hypothetical protein LOAG_10250 [Loa loa]|uniref:Uncharacterized protein n=1 Tax=Loa loa TaxID=7209 RepID=A0A1S0TQ99_LOALO|nr:hypothetical protein LOAG_10250 [Loa loa]EFO18246.1 hypothetical protein LOAG_10250 [Loa loa]